MVLCIIYLSHIYYYDLLYYKNGYFTGNHYGTPKPPKDPLGPSPFRRTNSTGHLVPGQHPSSEGKRRRNRSNIETSSNKSSPVHQPEEVLPPPMQRKKSLERAQSTSSLGPLPSKWEMSFTEDGTPYFIEYVKLGAFLLCVCRNIFWHFIYSWDWENMPILQLKSLVFTWIVVA